jgi:hypothetical protein
MSSNRSVTDEEILAGFASLHEAMANGFDGVRRQMAEMQQQILDVRNDVSRLEQRMLRRFDDIDGRLDRHDVRITALEART